MDDPKDFLLFLADRSGEISNRIKYKQGLDKLLRMMIGRLIDEDGESHKFVLGHPDFDIQNILVSDDGSLRAIIDWGWVVAVPRRIGCQKYSIWLTKDVDPFAECPPEERSPSALRRYRKIYAHSMESYLKTLGAARPASGKVTQALTRGSLLAGRLEHAAKAAEFTVGITGDIFLEINQATEGWDDNAVDAFLASRKSRESGNGNSGPAGSNGTGATETAAPAGRPVRAIRAARRPRLANPAPGVVASSDAEPAQTGQVALPLPSQGIQPQTPAPQLEPSTEATPAQKKRSIHPLANNHVPSEDLVSDTKPATDALPVQTKQVVFPTCPPPSKKPTPQLEPSTNEKPGKIKGIAHPLISPCSRSGFLVLEPLADATQVQIESFTALSAQRTSGGEDKPLQLSTECDDIAKAAVVDEVTREIATTSTMAPGKCGVARLCSWTGKKIRRTTKFLHRGKPAGSGKKTHGDARTTSNEEEAVAKASRKVRVAQCVSNKCKYAQSYEQDVAHEQEGERAQEEGRDQERGGVEEGGRDKEMQTAP